MRKLEGARKRSRNAHATVAVLATCAFVMTAQTSEQLPAFRMTQIAATTAVESIMAPAAELKMDLPSIESIQPVRSRPLSPKIMSAVAAAKRLDSHRALDHRLRELYRERRIFAGDILHLRRCITVESFAQAVRGWRSAAHDRMCDVEGVALFAYGHATLEMEVLWEDLFRRRIRREGAIQRILDGNIVRPVAQVARAA